MHKMYFKNDEMIAMEGMQNELWNRKNRKRKDSFRRFCSGQLKILGNLLIEFRFEGLEIPVGSIIR